MIREEDIVKGGWARIYLRQTDGVKEVQIDDHGFFDNEFAASLERGLGFGSSVKPAPARGGPAVPTDTSEAGSPSFGPR